MTDKIIGVVAALIRDDVGRMLVVRKRGTEAFMQPGGKRDHVLPLAFHGFPQ